MKKSVLISILSLIVISLFLIGGVSAGDSITNCWDGDVEPTPICSCDDLQRINTMTSQPYELQNNIDFSLCDSSYTTGAGFNEIGIFTDPFMGFFDGQGFSIIGLYINKPNSNIGLFGIIGSLAEVKDIHLINAQIYSESNDVGSLAGVNKGLITQCSSIGGIVKGRDNTGGLVGRNEIVAKITKSYFYGDVENSGSSEGLGGLVGKNHYGHIINSYSRGTVNGEDYVGGLVGNFVEGDIINSYSTSSITGLSYVGGLLGINNGITGGTCAYSFWNPKDAFPATESACGIKSTQTDMKIKSTYTNVNWNFDSIWNIDSLINDGYPFLNLEQASTENLYWADMEGNPIGEGYDKTKAEIGDTVLMIYEDMAGENFEFKIKEDGSIIKTINDVFDYKGHLAAKWTISQENIDDAQKWYEFWDLGTVEFVFEVDNQDSNILSVDEGSYDNTVPSTQITNPLPESNYTMDNGLTQEILFTQISSDEDDDLKLIWKFGDGSEKVFENIIKTGLGDTSHQYSDWGVKTINLRAEEMTRTQSDEDGVRIYVYNTGINVFAIIDEPNPNEVEKIEGRVVSIDASRSHAADCYKSLTECQSATNSAPEGSSGCYEIIDTLNNPSLYCYSLPKQGLEMKWEFYTGDKLESTKSGFYNEPDTDKVVKFNKVFNTPGEHELRLKVGYDDGK